jgi:threonine dehydratase
VVGVEPDSCPTLRTALRAGEPVDVEVGGPAADSLGAARAGAIGLRIAMRHVHDVVLVSDVAILEARRASWNETKVLPEPGAAAPLAALLSGAYVPAPDERVALVVSGGNADPATVEPSATDAG